MRDHWDVIIVGARCSGAALGTLLARQGVRTLILEADQRGTNMPMSTHYMQPPGMDVLDRLDVGARVRAVTPPTERVRLALDEVETTVKLLPGRSGYCVRRGTLDPWLQDAAEASGAELRCGQKVIDLARDADRVTGVVVQTARGRETLQAGLVVGADGAHSTVAKLTNAPEYLTTESQRGGFWSYYRAPSPWPFAWDSTLEHRADEIRYVFRADGDLVNLTYVTTLEEATSWGGSYREKLKQALGRSPITRTLSEGQEPVGKTIGLLRTRFFYRQPIGPGFALVGDAGHFKDFVTGQGMADALLDAERLASAIVQPQREAALEHFWRERDVATLPLHFDAIQRGRLGYNTPFMRSVISYMAEAPDLQARVARMLDRQIEPAELIPMSRMLRWMCAALLRGQFDVLAGFLAVGKAQAAEGKELSERRRLLRELERSQAASAARMPAADGGIALGSKALRPGAAR
jgi:flavin-dependent dehydrogenase